MKKFLVHSVVAFALVFAVSVPILADTIRLKDGSVIRGQIVSFKNEQFTILVGSGARGRKSRITVYMEDVDSIDFDASGNTSGPAEDNSSSQPAYQPPYQQPTNQPTNQPPYQQPANQPSNQPSYQPPPTNTSGRGPVPVPIQINVRVHADNASNGWTNSGFVVRRGQRIRITASGRVSLGKDRNGADRWSTPDGVANTPNTPFDRDKLMSRERTGALIAVIGDDNDDFILIGRDHDFVAQRDGVLFLGINEGNLSDNSGAFDVVIVAEASGSR